MRCWPLWLAPALFAAACSTTPLPPPDSGAPPAVDRSPPATKTPTRKPNVTLKRGGGFYKDDGPADDIPDGLDDIPDAVPRWEPLHKPALKPYVVLGKEYIPYTGLRPFKARGIASWYGRKFHGQKTSIGEPYDMFAMTAAHTTLPLPSYVRVTNVQTGRSIVVRLTDRGPFHADRVIDLSYTAAYKLGLIGNGSGEVEVEAILPGDPTATSYAQLSTPPTANGDKAALDALARRLAQEEAPVQLMSTPAALESAVAAKGIFLQLGAFASQDNADTLRNHLLKEWDWLREPARIFPGNGLYRVQVGPYATRAEADRVAERIRSLAGYKPTVVIR